MTIDEYLKEIYEDGKNERCSKCGCDLHWGKCPEGCEQNDD